MMVNSRGVGIYFIKKLGSAFIDVIIGLEKQIPQNFFDKFCEVMRSFLKYTGMIVTVITKEEFNYGF
jgi:hypothetical protein